jgi:unspecific monooxygenase
VWGDNVDDFDPDRFAPERVKARPAHAYKPFGTGERACIGRQFATHEAVLALGLILQRYGLRPDPTYRLRVKELLTLKPDGFTLRLTHRRAADRTPPPNLAHPGAAARLGYERPPWVSPR